MAVISTPPIWQQNRAYSARLDRQFADVFFGEGVIDVASGDFEVTQTSPLTNSVLVNTGRAVVTGDDEANQGKYLILSESVLNVVLNAAPPSNSRIDLVYLRVNDPVAGGPAGNNAEVTFVEGVAAPVPVAPSLPTTAIPLARILRTAGDTSITNAMITDLRGQALIVPGTALTANGDLLTRNAGSAVAIPVGSAGLPLLADSPIPAYGQVDTAGIADGAITAAKLDSTALTVLQVARVSTSGSQSTSSLTEVDIAGLTMSFTPVSASSTLIIDISIRGSVANVSALTEQERRGQIIIFHSAGLLAFFDVGRRASTSTTDVATSTVSGVFRAYVSSGSTSARTIKGQFLVNDSGTTFTVGGVSTQNTITVWEVQ